MRWRPLSLMLFRLICSKEPWMPGTQLLNWWFLSPFFAFLELIVQAIEANCLKESNVVQRMVFVNLFGGAIAFWPLGILRRAGPDEPGTRGTP
jgi:hypothetical protein